MELTLSEQIKIIMKREGVTMTKLSELVGQSRQNLSNKMTRNSFSLEDAEKIAAAMGYKFVVEFRKDDETADRTE